MSSQDAYDSSKIGCDLNSNSVEFLKIDLDTALTVARIALQDSSDLDKRTRNQTNARRAYDFVVERKPHLRIEDADAREIDEKLEQLKLALAELGESL